MKHNGFVVFFLIPAKILALATSFYIFLLPHSRVHFVPPFFGTKFNDQSRDYDDD